MRLKVSLYPCEEVRSINSHRDDRAHIYFTVQMFLASVFVLDAISPSSCCGPETHHLPPTSLSLPLLFPQTQEVATVNIECGTGEQILRWLAFTACSRLSYLRGE